MTFLIFCHLTACLFLFFLLFTVLQPHGEGRTAVTIDEHVDCRNEENGVSDCCSAVYSWSLGISAAFPRGQSSALLPLKFLGVLPLSHLSAESRHSTKELFQQNF